MAKQNSILLQSDDIHVESFAWSEQGDSIYFIAPVNGTLQLFKVNVPITDKSGRSSPAHQWRF
jgi:Tol biopolymer transport system component